MTGMGTKVHSKAYVPGYHSMRDPNEDSSSSSWSLLNGDKSIKNGPLYNGFLPRNAVDGYPGYDKDALKQKMLEHEEVFKNQVYELHRLYQIQRDMMEDVKRKELHRRASLEPSSSSTFHGSQVPSEDAWKWHMAGFPLPNSGYGTSSISPMSYAKGYDIETGRSPFQNELTSKDADALDSRPLKVRKKLFDLQLPADEYVDTEEGKHGNQESDNESSMKLPVVGLDGVKADRRIYASASASTSSLKKSVVLADLNEPFQMEEATPPSAVCYSSHTSKNGEINGLNQPAKSNAGHLAGETMYIHDGFFKRSSVESDVNEREHHAHFYKAEPSESNLRAVCQGLQQDKLLAPSNAVHDMLKLARHPHGMYPNGCSGDERWKEGMHKGLEFSNKNRDNSNNRHLEPFVACNPPDSYPLFSSSSFASSWAHSVSSLAKPTSSFTQKMAHFESSLNPASRIDKNLQNGFYHGSGSGSKKLHTSAGFDYLNCSRGASDPSTNHGFGNYVKGLNHSNSKPAIDINLNEVVSSEEAKTVQDLNVADGKRKAEDYLSALPWLKHKSDHGKEDTSARRSELLENNLQASSNQLFTNSLTISDLNQPFTPITLVSSDCENERRKEIVKTQNVQKVLGFPIFETGASENKPSSHVSTFVSVDCPPSVKNVRSERNKRIIDLNLEYELDEQIPAEELTVEKEKQASSSRVREEIDLNSFVNDWEDPSAPSSENKTAIVKRTFEIDLEAPVPVEIEEDNARSKENTSEEVILPSLENKTEQIPDDVAKNAAEAMLSISSSCPVIHKTLEESLLWFVDAVSTHANELKNATGHESLPKNGSQKQDLPEEIDEFELMTLQIQETKEEDYMPAPFVPEVQKVEETGASTTRPRRGQARRGRPRRDFQGDILPGLASLSRHEVTEDLQTFGGMMRATGHTWNTGSTRRNGTRNGRGRGRRRAVVEPEPVPIPVPNPVCSSAPLMQQLNIIEDSSSLTGWGKTTRRPRRQRCPPAGNTPTVVLT